MAMVWIIVTEKKGRRQLCCAGREPGGQLLFWISMVLLYSLPSYHTQLICEYSMLCSIVFDYFIVSIGFVEENIKFAMVYLEYSDRLVLQYISICLRSY